MYNDEFKKHGVYSTPGISENDNDEDDEDRHLKPEGGVKFHETPRPHKMMTKSKVNVNDFRENSNNKHPP